MNHCLHLLLVCVGGVEQAFGGKQAHHYLLRGGESGCVVESHVAAVGHHSVDKAQALDVESQRAVAAREVVFLVLRQLGNHAVEYILFCGGHHGESPARCPEVFRERVHADGVLRQAVEEGVEFVGKGGIYLVGNHDEVGIVLAHDVD